MNFETITLDEFDKECGGNARYYERRSTYHDLLTNFLKSGAEIARLTDIPAGRNIRSVSACANFRAKKDKLGARCIIRGKKLYLVRYNE